MGVEALFCQTWSHNVFLQNTVLLVGFILYINFSHFIPTFTFIDAHLYTAEFLLQGDIVS